MAGSSSNSIVPVVQQLDPDSLTMSPVPPYIHNFIARLCGRDHILLISEHRIVVGRVSNSKTVDFELVRNKYISREHFVLQYRESEFTVEVLSKNGLFVDHIKLPRSYLPYTIPKTCTFRFPSTDEKIVFENLIEPTINFGMAAYMNNLTRAEREMMNCSRTLTVDTAYTSGSGFAVDGNGNENNALNPIPYPTAWNMYNKVEESVDYPSDKMSGTDSKRAEISGISLEASGSGDSTAEVQQFDNWQDVTENNNSSSLTNATQLTAYDKPPYSYAQLIVQAITSTPEQQCALPEICAYVRNTYPYFQRRRQEGWQNSIRHNLSLNRQFIKVPRVSDAVGKGCYWRIDPAYYEMALKKRFQQRMSYQNRTDRFYCYSAPETPTHSDDSRGDLMLDGQSVASAPGSPAQTVGDAPINYTTKPWDSGVFGEGQCEPAVMRPGN